MNEQLELAAKYIQLTNTNIFLTGKAGTGKTTFLKSLKKITSKRFVVLAPTGVAAINAGGVTIHSFFQLPFNPYLPGGMPRTRKFSKQKLNIIRSLDLIVIDEISMVRCDVLDEMDYMLRHLRYNSLFKPFGGVQLLMIGDLSQLPPVVTEVEMPILSKYYDSFFFFGSNALKNSTYITITLQHIYRQTDKDFIDILNAVRNNYIDQTIIDKLNTRYVPNILNNLPRNHIVLCTHNNQADSINDKQLDKLDAKEKVYEAEVTGDFSESTYPNSFSLKLKKGAQVMFLKNDYSSSPNAPKKYYNGKIGIVKDLQDDFVVVQCSDSNEDIVVEKYSWENIIYAINQETKAITPKIKGTFMQIPLKLAWAVTIHKSQGLTFDNVIISSNRAFSHGQVYVALSRCRTLQGIILTEKFDSASVLTDKRVEEFTNNSLLNAPNEQSLMQAKADFDRDNIISVFDFTEITFSVDKLSKFIHQSLYKVYPAKTDMISEQIKDYKFDVQEVSKRFNRFITNVDAKYSDENTKRTIVIQKALKAKEYFLEKLKLLDEIVLDLIVIDLDSEKENLEFKTILVDIAREKEIKHRLLTFFTENFNSEDYLKYRNSVLVEGDNLELQSIKEFATKQLSDKQAQEKKETNDTKEDIADKELFELLRTWRRDEANNKNLPAYCVVSQKTLIAICNQKPTTKDELRKIKGVGDKIMNSYGEAILHIINNYLTD